MIGKKDKEVVLITGCSSGLGKCLCNTLSDKGLIVIATARNIQSIENVKAAMKIELDVTKNNQIESAVKSVISKYGRIDILINNAGYSIRSAVEELNIESAASMFDVNVFGIIRMIHFTAPYMRKQHSGKIINIGSISGRLTSTLNGGYCASKHSVEAITEAARYELKQFGVQVTVIEPGAMDTDFFNTLGNNSDKLMNNTKSPYYSLNLKDIAYRKKQNRASIESSAAQICKVISKCRLKVRYKISLSIIFYILLILPSWLREKMILKFG